MRFLKRIFGLKGSWPWAVRQMKKGRIVRPAGATGAVKYRAHEVTGQILWSFKNRPFLEKKDFHSAKLFCSDFKATDWVLWKRADEDVRR